MERSQLKRNVYRRLRRKQTKIDWISEYWPHIQGHGIQEDRDGKLKFCLYHLKELPAEVRKEIEARMDGEPVMWSVTTGFVLD